MSKRGNSVFLDTEVIKAFMKEIPPSPDFGVGPSFMTVLFNIIFRR